MQDTTGPALAKWRQVFAALSPARKWQMLGESYAAARALHAAGAERRGNTTPEATQRDWLTKTYHLDVAYPGAPRMSPIGNLAVVREVANILQNLGIDYALGGSMASSVFGIARFTQDADLTVAPFLGKEEALVQSFGPEYYLSLSAVQTAVQSRSTFNIIHTREGFKVDLFVCKDDPFEQGALARRVPLTLPGQSDALYFQSPEDVCLFKLRWYRMGNESSSQQWQDVLGVLSSERDRLDNAYMIEWSARLGIDDLLRKAQAEV